MRDINQDSTNETPYSCFDCGEIIHAKTHPSECPDCGGAMRNRQTPLE